MARTHKDKLDTYGQGASPLVRQIIELILEEIDKLEDDKPLAPELDLADSFGVSRKTIRAAMKRLEDHGLVRRIKRKGTFPTRGRNAKPLFRNEVSRIGLLVPRNAFHSKSTYYKLIIDGVCGTALENNYQIMISTGTESTETNDAVFRFADDNSIDAICLIGVTSQQLLLDLEKWNKPVCLIDHYSEAKSVDCVRTDSNKGSQLAIEHLYRLGHKKIAFANTKNIETNPARLAGFRDGLKRWKLKRNKDWVFYANSHENEAEEIAMQYLALDTNDRPSAIVAFSDSMAEGIAETLTSFGINIPQDLCLVGTKGFSNPQTEADTGTTNVCFNWEIIGATAVETIIERLQSPRSKGQNILIPPHLEISDSTSKFKA